MRRPSARPGARASASLLALCISLTAGRAAAQSAAACATDAGIECRAINATLQYLRTARSTSPTLAPGSNAAHVLQLLRTACWREHGDACYIAGRLTMAWGASSPESLLPALDSAAALFRHGCGQATRPSAAACNELAELFYYRTGGTDQRDSAMVYYARGCRLGNSTACFRWGARLIEYPELGRVGAQRELAAVRAACVAGSTGGCVAEQYTLDTLLSHMPDSLHSSAAFRSMAQRSLELARAGCANGNSVACTNLGAAFGAGQYAVPQNRDSAIHYYGLACSGQNVRVSGTGRSTSAVHVLGYGPACRILGQELRTSIADPTVAADSADSAYARGCDITYMYTDACGSLALLRFQRAGDRAARRAAYVLAMAACLGSDAVSCRYAGWMLLPQQLDDPAQALSYLHRACQMNDAWSCHLAGLNERTGIDSVKSLRRACDLQETTSCLALALFVRQRYGFEAQADTLELRACDLDNALGCWRAMLRYRSLDGADAEMREGVYRAKACRLDRTYCKKSIS